MHGALGIRSGSEGIDSELKLPLNEKHLAQVFKKKTEPSKSGSIRNFLVSSHPMRISALIWLALAVSSCQVGSVKNCEGYKEAESCVAAIRDKTWKKKLNCLLETSRGCLDIEETKFSCLEVKDFEDTGLNYESIQGRFFVDSLTCPRS